VKRTQISHTDNLSELKIALPTTPVKNADIVIGKAKHRCQLNVDAICQVNQSRIKGKGARDNFHRRAPMTYAMTSSFVKFMFLLIRNIIVCLFQ